MMAAQRIEIVTVFMDHNLPLSETDSHARIQPRQVR